MRMPMFLLPSTPGPVHRQTGHVSGGQVLHARREKVEVDRLATAIHQHLGMNTAAHDRGESATARSHEIL